jgi:hypothetical protein
MAGKAAFFAPLMITWPSKGWPPKIKNLSIGPFVHGFIIYRLFLSSALQDRMEMYASEPLRIK